MKILLSTVLFFNFITGFGQDLQSMYEKYKSNLSENNLEVAINTLDSLLTMDPNNNYWLVGKAEIHAALGQKEEAVSILQKAIDNGYRNLAEIVKNEHFEGISSSKQFNMIVEKLEKELSSYKLKDDEQKLTIEIPPLMECYVIMLYLSNSDHPLINKKRDHFYFDRIDTYFKPYLSSSHLKQIHKIYPGNRDLWINNLRAHHNLRTLYVFDSLDIKQIKRFPLELDKDLAKLVREFALETDFMEFYEANSGFYNAMKRIMKTNYAFGSHLIPFFNKNFETKIQRFNIYFSPIYGGWQHGPTARIGDYIESFYFGGIMYTPEEEFYYPDVFLLFTFLTEFDHTTINMLTDEFSKEIAALKEKTPLLNTSGKVSYGSIKATVNEYITWAFALQFFYEHTPLDYANLEESIVTWMEEGRKFAEFGNFMKFYKKYMQNRTTYPLLRDFYPEIIDWFSNV